MSIGLTGIQMSQLAGAAGAVKLPFQLSATPASMQAVGMQQSGSMASLSLPAEQMMNAAAAITTDAIATNKSGTSNAQILKSEAQILADVMGAKTEALWRLATRFLTASDSFTMNLLGSATTTAPARTLPAQKSQAATKVAPIVSGSDTPTEIKETDHSKASVDKPVHAKTNPNISLMGNGIEIEDLSLELSKPPKTPLALSTKTASTPAAPKQSVSQKIGVAVTTANGPFENVVPYSVSQLDRARTILRAAGVTLEGGTTSSFTKTTTSPAISRTDPRGASTPKNTRSPQKVSHKGQTTKHAQAFKRSPAVGRSPAFLVGNIRAKKARKVEPAQIVRVATSGSTDRRIVFARVPGTKGEYRYAGVERHRKTTRAQHRTAPHALAAPYAGRRLQQTILSLAPPAVGGGETAYTMPNPRELRADERQVLMSMLKEQLALGPASLGNSAIRDQFNAYMFSNTIGEMSHYVTADQWNAMVRATVLYAARAVLPFSNNSITGTAAEYLFDNVDAEQRYDAWMDHFGISGLSDIALMDTLADEERILTMPEYFLKGIMDYLADLAPVMHAYDEDAMPLPFTTELSLQWETIAFIHDPAISNDSELILAATAFAEEIAALDVGAAQHFVELVLLSTLVSTDSIQGVWSEDQAVAFVSSSIEAGLSDVIDPIGRNSSLPRRVRRLLAIAKEGLNAAEDKYQIGMDRLTRNLADAIQNGAFSIESDESEELRLN